MALTSVGIRTTFVAAVDLSAKQWHFVKAGSVSGEVNVATGGSGPAPIGILENNPLAGEAAAVCIFGLSKLSASAAYAWAGTGSAIAMGDNLTAGGAGKGYHASTCVQNAIALEALAVSTAAIIQVFVVSPGSELFDLAV